MTILVALLLSLLGGCVSAVTLRDPATGAVVKCGPYSALSYFGPTSAWDRDWMPKAEDRQARCVDAYFRQGYVKTSN
jgi:hypothetical protein